MCDKSQPTKLLWTRYTVMISTLWLGYYEENLRILTPELLVVVGRSWGVKLSTESIPQVRFT